jgi:hypothetical protein
MVSQDNRMTHWSFSDMSDRVSFILSCTDDAGGVSGWQARLDGLKKEQQSYPTWTIQATDDDDYLLIAATSK